MRPVSRSDAARVVRSVLGVDLSEPAIEYARRRSEEEGLGNVSYLRADAQVHPYPAGHFDLCVSRFGVMSSPTRSPRSPTSRGPCVARHPGDSRRSGRRGGRACPRAPARHHRPPRHRRRSSLRLPRLDHHRPAPLIRAPEHAGPIA
ncbi:MAG: class I SAM-dependent methyltransferase [Actinoallomurus sp.]